MQCHSHEREGFVRGRDFNRVDRPVPLSHYFPIKFTLPTQNKEERVFILLLYTVCELGIGIHFVLRELVEIPDCKGSAEASTRKIVASRELVAAELGRGAEHLERKHGKC